MKLSLVKSKGQGAGGGDKAALSLFCILYFAFFSASCATKMVEMPAYEGIDLETMLTEKGRVRSMDSTFSIEFERDGNITRGDAVLQLTHESLDLQIYSLGFLVAEVTADSTTTRSNPPFERNRLSMLIDGLRNTFFWWTIKNPDIRDVNDTYIVSNSWRRVLIDKKTMMPIKQTIGLEDGRQLTVLYEEPVLIGEIWFPSRIRMELSSYSASIEIRTLLFNTRLVPAGD